MYIHVVQQSDIEGERKRRKSSHDSNYTADMGHIDSEIDASAKTNGLCELPMRAYPDSSCPLKGPGLQD